MTSAIFTILVIGLSGICAQVVILRELLVGFQGNELTLGVILGNWLIAEALGAFLSSRHAEQIAKGRYLFIVLQLTFCLGFIFAIYFSRLFKLYLGIPPGEGISLQAICGVSFLALFWPAFAHGALFSLCCRLFAGVAKVYSLETAGTILGGLGLTYIFLPQLNSFQIAFAVIVLNMLVCLFFLRNVVIPARRVFYLLGLILAFAIFLQAPQALENSSLRKQWRQGRILGYLNSLYGNSLVLEKASQRTFFYNGRPVITLPLADSGFIEELGNIPLLFAAEPKQVLVIGAGAAGLLNEILKHQPQRIDYAELDPQMIKMLKKYPSSLTEAELGDPRVNLVNSDGRLFLYRAETLYDCIIIGLSASGDLLTNRLFTEEFFALAKTRLRQNGILAMWLPGSSAYLSPQLRDINFALLNALAKVFGSLRVIPGDYNLILASGGTGNLDVESSVIISRVSQRRIPVKILVPDYLAYRLDRKKLEWFLASAQGATRKINRDLFPFSVYLELIFWSRQFSPGIARFFGSLEKINIWHILGLAALFALMFRRLRNQKAVIAGSIATTGFYGMLINLVLVFSFQVFYGYVYQMLGLLIGVFMAGAALGSAWMNRRLKATSELWRLFIGLEWGIVIFSLAVGVVLVALGSLGAQIPYLSFIPLFLAAGFFLGVEFPLAVVLYSQDKANVGLLYAVDLLGGWFAGLVSGILLLPLLGLFNTCLSAALLKLATLGTLTRASRLGYRAAD